MTETVTRSESARPVPDAMEASMRRLTRFFPLALSATLAVVVGLALSTPATAVTEVKRVRCALPYTSGSSANFMCSSQHKILFTADGFTNNNATIKAELLAVDLQGNILQAIPVNSGDLAMLASRTDPKDLKVTSVNNKHTVNAPIPLLRVTAEDGTDKA